MIKIGDKLTLNEIERVALYGEEVRIADTAIQVMRRSHKLLMSRVLRGEKVYGVTTGFGKLSDVNITKEQGELLQQNLILSHSCGVGDYLSEEEVRAMMLLRAHMLAQGYSGVRQEVVELLCRLLNDGVYPAIPSQGSVGASGDLVLLAHLALVLIGQGTIIINGKESSATDYFNKIGIQPLRLQTKEGLSLINGTQASTAIAVLSAHKANRLSFLADLIGAISAEALRSTDTAFNEKITLIRPYTGAIKTAQNLRYFLQGSQIRKSHLECSRIQDNYCIRCMPQVHGIVKDCISYILQMLEIEVNSITDNPILFPDTNEIISGGNFHGEPVAVLMDLLSINMAQLSNISERRLFLLTDDPEKILPPFLIQDAGLNSGFMIAQVVAASLVSENKVLSHPSSVDSIPTSANKEDYVSMSCHAARKARIIVDNAEKVLALEMMAGLQGLDFHGLLKSSPHIEKVKELIREHISFLDRDRILSQDINILITLFDQIYWMFSKMP